MDIQFITVPPTFKGLIDHAWVMCGTNTSPGGGFGVATPDGKPKLIFPYKTEQTELTLCNRQIPVKSDRMILVHILTNPVFIRFRGTLKVYGFDLSPAAFYRIPEVKLYGIPNNICMLSQINGMAVQEIHHNLSQITEHEDLFIFISKLLGDKPDSPQKTDKILCKAMTHIHASGGNIRIEELAEQLGYTKRYIDRIFANKTGISPKQYASIIRFHGAYRELMEYRKKQHKNALCYISDNYFDQAHFIKAFKKYTSLSPSVLLHHQLDFGKQLIPTE